MGEDFFFFFSSRRRHTRWNCDWSSDVCSSDLHARKVMSALWGMGLMMLAKTIVVVSDHVNVHDLSEVAWRATGNLDPRRDLVLFGGPADALDHAALRHRFGGKLGVDATEK